MEVTSTPSRMELRMNARTRRAFGRRQPVLAVGIVLLGALPILISTACMADPLRLTLAPADAESPGTRIRVEIQHIGSSPIVVPLLFIPEDYYVRFEIRDEEGSLARFVGKEVDWKESSNDFLWMYPSSRFSQALDLREYYRLEPGTYSVTAIYDVAPGRRKETGLWSGVLRSSALEIVVH